MKYILRVKPNLGAVVPDIYVSQVVLIAGGEYDLPFMAVKCQRQVKHTLENSDFDEIRHTHLEDQILEAQMETHMYAVVIGHFVRFYIVHHSDAVAVNQRLQASPLLSCI